MFEITCCKCRVHSKPTNIPPLPQSGHKIGIEFLQLLLAFQLMWTTGQQHVAVPRLIQPETVSALVARKGTPNFALSDHLQVCYASFDLYDNQEEIRQTI